MRIFIDDMPFEATPDQFIIDVAQQNGIEIPQLCHHDALWGQACCRLCVVEAIDARDKHSIVVSCTYPVKDGLKVYTKTEKIVQLRRMILALLKEQAPEAQGKLPEYCREYNVADYGLQFNKDKDEKCILCGLCSKACEELGSCAIQTTMRGIDKVVAPPFNEPPETCIGCAACSRVCPTNAIECIDVHAYDQDTRTIWGKTFVLQRCAACGKPYATQEELEWLKGKLLDTELNLSYCPACRGRVSIATS